MYGAKAAAMCSLLLPNCEGSHCAFIVQSASVQSDNHDGVENDSSNQSSNKSVSMHLIVWIMLLIYTSFILIFDNCLRIEVFCIVSDMFHC